MSDEIWKIIDDCPAYEVSSLGRVRRALPGKRTRVGNILRQNPTGGGGKYLGVTLVMNGMRQYRMVHRLVCAAFNGPPPFPDDEAAHGNGKSRDNRSDNLSWKRHDANSRDRITHGTQPRGASVEGGKLTEDQVRAIRAKHDGRRSGYAQTAAEYGVHKTLIAQIVRNEIWRHVR